MKKKEIKKIHVIFLAIVAVLIFICILAFSIYRHLSPDIDAPCQKNVERLQKMETADITTTEKRLQVLQKNATSVSSGTPGVAEDVQASILAGNILSNVEIRQKFQNTVILGDSITESISGYGYLDTDVVIAQLGLSIKAADDHIATAISLQPSTIFMAFGANDLEIYVNDSESFVNAYRTQIEKLQNSLPDVPIYINAILPILPSTIEQYPPLGYYPEFNKALEGLCAELGCTFIDGAFLLENNEAMYEPDGEHVVMSFYPSWLTFMAEMAGL